MKRYWKVIVLEAIVIIVVVPLIIAYLLSFRIIPTDTTNEWIGFWGGYLGAIFGGIITLIVLHFTLKDNKKNLKATLDFEKEKIRQERKTQFNDELLELLIEYQTWIEGFCEYHKKLLEMEDNSESFEKTKTKGVILSKMIYIKLSSKKNNSNYKYTQILLNNIDDIANFINNLDEVFEKYEDPIDILGETSKRFDRLYEKSSSLMKHIENYYVENEGK